MEVKMNTSHVSQEPKITFGKGVRVGNFRLYKIRKGVGSKETIEALTIASLDQTWSITIPSTMNNFLIIEGLYSSGETDILERKLQNIYLACTLSLPYLDDLLFMLFAMMVAPDNELTDKEGKKYKIYDALANNVRWVAEDLISKREQEKFDEENDPEKEENLKHDETFHDMVEELQKMEKKEANDGAKSE